MPLSDRDKARLAEVRLRMSRGEMPVATAPNLARPGGTLSFGEAVVGEMTPGDLQVKDFARSLLNALPSGWNIVKDTASAGAGLLPLKTFGVGEENFSTVKGMASVASGGTLEMLEKMGFGSILKGAEAVVGKTEGEEYKAAFEQFVEGLKEKYGTPQEWASGDFSRLHATAVRDPIGLLLDVSPFKVGALKMAGKTAKAFVRPVSMPLGVVQKGAHVAASAAKEGGAFVGSLTTGMPTEAFRVGIEAGAKAGPLRARPFRRVKATDPADELTEFRKAASEQVPVQQIADILDEAQPRIKVEAGERFAELTAGLSSYAADFGKLENTITKQLEKQWGVVRHTEPSKVRKEPGNILDAMGVPAMRDIVEPSRVTDKLVAVQRHPGMPGTASLGTSLPRVQRAFDLIVKPEYRQDLLGLHHMALDLNRLHTGAKILKSGKAKSADAVIVQMEETVRKHMKAIDPDFAQASLEYSQKMRLLENIATILSGTVDNSETKVTKVLQSMRESATVDVRRDVIKMLKVATGKHIAEMAAGSVLSQWAPSGIHARRIALTGIGAATVFIDPRFFLALPTLALTMPRFWASFTPAFGIPLKAARKLEEWSGKLRARIPENLLDTGVDIGTIVNRMLEEGIEPPPFPDIGEPIK